MARERGLTYVKLDGNVGILGNGAGLVMSTLDVVAQAGGAPANFLDAGGGSKAEAITQRGRGDPLQRERHRRAVQHLRRHHALRRGRQGPDRGVRARSSRPCRSSCGWTAPTTRRAARCSPRPTCPTCTRRRRCSAPPSRSWSWRAMSILVDNDTKLCVSGITGREGTFHTLNNKRYGTNVVSGVTPGKGGQDVEGIPVFNTFHDAVAETGANTAMIFVPPRFAADSILEAEDAGIALDRRDHRGHPRPRRAARLQPPRAQRRRAPGRPELPRHPLARQGQRRDHPGRLLQARATSASSRARAR